MLVFRHFLAIGTGVILILGYETAAAARPLPSSGQQTEQPSSSAVLMSQATPEQPRRQEELPEISPQITPPEELRPLPPNRPARPGPAPEEIEPSSNPLLFPTAPEEVNPEIVQPISLEQAIGLALRNNQELQITRLQLERSRAELRETQAELFPTLSLSTSISREESIGEQSTGDINDFFDLLQGGGTNNGITTDTGDGDVDPGIDNGTTTDTGDGDVDPGIDNGTDPDEVDDISPLQEDGTDTDTDTGNGNGTTSGTGTNTDEDDESDTVSVPFTTTLELSYDLYTGGRREGLIRAAERQVRSNQLEVEQIAEETRFNVATDYFELQSADAQVEIEQARVEDAAQTLRDAQLLEQAGLGTRFDVLQAEVELADANQAVTTAFANQRSARRQLGQTINVGQEVVLTAADEIQESGAWNLSLEESIVLAYKNRAELEQFLLQREIDESQRRVALADIKPQVNVFANYGIGERLDSNEGFDDEYALGARLQWLLFDGGAARARARQEERDVEIAEVNFDNQQNQVRLEVETAYFNLQANQRNIETSERAVELAEESLRLARLRFQAGVGTQTEVIDAQSALTEARGNFLNAIIEYNQSLNQLQRAVSNIPDNRLFNLP